MNKKFKYKKKKFQTNAAKKDSVVKSYARYEDIVRENKNFETFYKAQNLVPQNDWNSFLSCLKENLPSAFRITGTRKQACALLKVLKEQLFEPLSKVDIEKIGDDKEELKKLKPLALLWYPNEFAWQLNLTRRNIRRCEAYWKLHQFLTTETETGYISRQEAVSMIPPLVLDVQCHHKVLDMCAAPGSKTAQLIEFLHSSEDLIESAIPKGVIVANDADNKRCYMLTHQAKRLQSPSVIITNHDAAFMPNIYLANSGATQLWIATSMSTMLRNPPVGHQDSLQLQVSCSTTRNDFALNAPCLAFVGIHLPFPWQEHDGVSVPLKFDRVLCDVPCSGDGTLRKNFDIWTKWNPLNGPNLHGLQLRIARRGLELLKVGGKLVYSTCSLNPLENEAVVHRLLLEGGESLKLIDIAEKLPGLKYISGLCDWTIMNKEMEVISSPNEIPLRNTNLFNQYLFPPNPESVLQNELKKCIRILPHHQDTGGFFVAVFEKLNPLPGEKFWSPKLCEGSASCQTQKIRQPSRKKKCARGFREEPFFYLNAENATWCEINKFFGIKEDIADPTLFLTRNLDGRNIYFTSSLIRDIILQNQDKIKIINSGVKIFVKCDHKGSLCSYRLAQEGSNVILPTITERKISIEKNDLVTMLLNDDMELPPEITSLSQTTQEQCSQMSTGSAAFIYSTTELVIKIVGWKGKNTVRAYVGKNERLHFLRLLSADTSKYEVNKFQEQRKIVDEKCITE